VGRERTSIGCAVAALAAYGIALAILVRGYAHAVDTACATNGAPAPAGFWPLLIGSVVLSVVAFTLRGRRSEHSGVGGTALAVFVVVAVPLAALGTVFGYWVTYGCWE
jgi:hypothetical protein